MSEEEKYVTFLERSNASLIVDVVTLKKKLADVRKELKDYQDAADVEANLGDEAWTELAALREAVGQLLASAKACLRHADKYGFLPTNVIEVQVLNHQQYDRTDMTVAHLRAAVAAFDRVGEK